MCVATLWVHSYTHILPGSVLDFVVQLYERDVIVGCTSSNRTPSSPCTTLGEGQSLFFFFFVNAYNLTLLLQSLVARIKLDRASETPRISQLGALPQRELGNKIALLKS